MLKIIWKDEVPNTEVLKRVGEKEEQFFRKIVQQKLAYAGHVLTGSNGRNALVILEGKIRGKRAKVIDPGKCGSMMSGNGQC